MKASLRTLLSGVIDYAGLFPPAQLSTEQTLRNYSEYRGCPDGWMLSRLIWPVTRLGELVLPCARAAEADIQEPWSVSILSRGGRTSREFLDALARDLAVMDAFCSAHGASIVTDAYEVRLPADVTARSAAAAFRDFLTTVTETIEGLGLPALALSFEVALEADWRASLEATAREVGLHNKATAIRQQNCRPVGLKLRCGGVEASAFPSTEQVAFAISTCRDSAAPLKFTAGLHHPIRRFDPTLGTPMHGFLNLFVAGALASFSGLTEAEVHRIVEDEEAANFRFEDKWLSWKGMGAPNVEIEEARQKLVLSFGSCSFDEPRDDLQALGLL